MTDRADTVALCGEEVPVMADTVIFSPPTSILRGKSAGNVAVVVHKFLGSADTKLRVVPVVVMLEPSVVPPVGTMPFVLSATVYTSHGRYGVVLHSTYHKKPVIFSV